MCKYIFLRLVIYSSPSILEIEIKVKQYRLGQKKPNVSHMNKNMQQFWFKYHQKSKFEFKLENTLINQCR